MNDPTNWNTDLETLKVGDAFTEEWLDRFRELMAAYNEAKALLVEAQDVLSGHWFTSVTDSDGYGEDFNNDDVIDMDKKIQAWIASHSTWQETKEPK